MASIVGSGKEIRVWWVDPATRRRRSKQFNNRAAALAFAADREKEQQLVRDGWINETQIHDADRRRTALADLVDEWNADREHRQVSQAEIDSTTSIVNLVLGRARIHRVREIDAGAIKATLRDLARSKSWGNRTWNRYREACSGFFAWLVKHRYLDRNPGELIDALDAEKDPKRPSRALTFAEADALVDSALEPCRRLLYLLRLRTGLRERECLRLRWSDFDLADAVLTLRADVTKNGKPGRLPLAADLVAEIFDYQTGMLRAGTAPAGMDPLFTSKPCRRTWRRDLDRAGITFKTDAGQADAKALRKTFDSFLSRSGCDLLLVSLLMRHTPPAGLKLTLGTYGDHDELLRRQATAVESMVRWIESQREVANAKTG